LYRNFCTNVILNYWLRLRLFYQKKIPIDYLIVIEWNSITHLWFKNKKKIKITQPYSTRYSANTNQLSKRATLTQTPFTQAFATTGASRTSVKTLTGCHSWTPPSTTFGVPTQSPTAKVCIFLWFLYSISIWVFF
jgi:hypothetical protein